MPSAYPNPYVVTNTAASNTLTGEDAIVTLGTAQASIYLGGMGKIFLGEQALVTSANVYGYVSEIDVYGQTFRIKPQVPSGNLSSSGTPGVLKANELITLF